MLSKTLYFPLVLLSCLAVSLSGCIQDSCRQSQSFVQYTPVYRPLGEIRQEVGTEQPRTLEKPGKLYFKDHFLFIGEINQGIHIFNNVDPAKPEPVAFLKVPGARDMAIKGNFMYVDSYVDLVVLDISDPTQAKEVSRELDVFPYGSWHNGLWADETQGIAVDWIEEEITQEVDCSNPGWPGRNVWGLDILANTDFAVAEFASNSQFDPGAAGGAEVSTGIGGSMARFTLLGNYLYVVTNTDLQTYEITDLANPNQVHTTPVGWDIETLYPFEGNLFIGSMSAMFIYSLDNPAEPQHLSAFQHARACDPVVVEKGADGNTYAYVTLRDGTRCEGFENELNVINVNNLRSPYLVQRYDFHQPHGLGIRDHILFICDGDEGLKVYDATDVNEITSNELAHFKDIHAFDVIPLFNVLLLIGDDGFYQYDYSDPTNIKLLSKIEVAS